MPEEKPKLQIRSISPTTASKFKTACAETGRTQSELLDILLEAYQNKEKVAPVKVELKDPELEHLLYQIEKELRSGAMTQGKADGYRLRLKKYLHKGLLDSERREIQKVGKLLEEFTPQFNPKLKKEIESFPKLAFRLWRTGRMKNYFQADEEITAVCSAYAANDIAPTDADLKAYIEHIRIRHAEEDVKRGRPFFNYFTGGA